VTIAQIWQDFLAIIRQEVGSRVVETWLKALVLERWDETSRTAYIRAPNTFVRDWVVNHYRALFDEHLARLFAVESIQVCFLDKEAQTQTATVVVPARLLIEEREQADARKNQTINNTYQFDTFVVGPSNSLSYAAAHAVTERPGFAYNPLFVYGASGLGKTHLLNAIGNGIKKKYRKLSVLYQSADRFVSEFIHAIRFDKVDLFKDKYRAVDVLLIDDIQFIAHKEQTQEAFFHIFNSLYESSKQIVFSSDTYPSQMHGIAERLRSRFACGLITDIQKPTVEEKIAILKRKADGMGHMLTDDVADYIAQQPLCNIRELEGMLVRLYAFASLTGQAVQVDLVKKVLQRPQLAVQKRAHSLDDIFACVIKASQYSATQLRNRSRNKDVVLVRQVAMFLMKKFSEASLQEIGSFLRRNDHSTVSHAIDKIQKMAPADARVRAIVERVERSLAL